MACMGVTSAADLPQGMISCSVPANKYAVFTTTLKTMRATYQRVEEWLPKSGYHRAKAPDFELYDEHFAGEDSPFYIYVPIE